MKIKSIKIAKLQIPLIRPFITAIRRTEYVEDVVVMIKTDSGNIGYGSAASTPAITGDSLDSIISVIKNIIAPKLIGQNIFEFNHLLQLISTGLQGNFSAKAALDIAIHDLFAQACQLPLYKLLGGGANSLETCVTISVKDTPTMVSDAKLLINQGFKTLKIKVGVNPKEDLERIKAIIDAVGDKSKILIDANQGWTVKDALQIINEINKLNLAIELIEQPVLAKNLTGLKFLQNKANNLIIADEACFSPNDALTIVKEQISDGLNIKLMKCGGIANAETIYQIANTANMPCMVGAMLESPISIAAMASFAVTKTNLLFADLDPIALIKENPIVGGAKLNGNQISLSDEPGLGIKDISSGCTIIGEIQ